MNLSQIRCRCTLARLRDSRIYRGWLTEFDFTQVRIRAMLKGDVVPGDLYLIEVHGYPQDSVFPARLESGSQSAAVVIREGATAYVQEASFFELQLRVEGTVKIVKMRERPRFLVRGVEAVLHAPMGQESVIGVVQDLSQEGFSVASPVSVPAGTSVRITLKTDLGPIRLTAHTRNQRPINAQEFVYRLGFEVDQIERFDLARWREFWRRLLLTNRVDLPLDRDRIQQAA